MLRLLAYGWLRDFYIEPEWFFGYPGFEWVQPGPAWFMYGLVVVLAVLALLIAVGVFFRGSVALFALGFLYLELLDQTHYLNHYYLVTLLCGLVFFMPLGRAYSRVPRWCLWLLRLQFGLVYFYAGVAKLGPDWLLRAEPLRTWFAAEADMPIVGPLLTMPWAAYTASWVGAILDLSAAFLLLWSKTRGWMFCVVLVFHFATGLLFPLGLFPWLMVAGATLFFAPNWPRTILGRGAPPLTGVSATAHDSRIRRCLLALYLVTQLVLPLRHWLYPGDVLRTEEGMRFSWKVMIAEKASTARFTITDAKSGRSWLVYPREYLTRRQEKMMSTQPEMIRQFAHKLARKHQLEHGSWPEVRAEVYVAINGRRSRRLIDSDVDLAAQEFSLASYRWILR